LDLCAAPGGKTAQIAHAGADVVALDVSASRLRRLTGNLDRLGLKAQTHVGSACDFDPEQLFDAVLVDAPCSSTGTIRRHPDVAWTKTPADVTKLAKLQFDLLSKAASFVKAGGTLVFSNCSLLEEEGEALAGRALDEIPSLKLSPVNPNELPQMAGLIAPEGWIRTTPADFSTDRPQTSGMDGFFAVRFSVV
ncbi:MAG: RsmB/NOP family class I SAM-dependent RNA methyltransferase, partial [Rhizobiaceae bacterium]